MINMFITLLNQECMHMSKLIQLYTLNMCSFLYVNFILIRLFLKKRLRGCISKRQQHDLFSENLWVLSPHKKGLSLKYKSKQI